MKKTITLSQEAQEAVKILEDIEKKLDQYEKLQSSLSSFEKNLIGAIVIAIYSLPASLTVTAQMGQRTIIYGLVQEILERWEATKSSQNPLEVLLKKSSE